MSPVSINCTAKYCGTWYVGKMRMLYQQGVHQASDLLAHPLYLKQPYLLILTDIAANQY